MRERARDQSTRPHALAVGWGMPWTGLRLDASRVKCADVHAPDP